MVLPQPPVPPEDFAVPAPFIRPESRQQSIDLNVNDAGNELLSKGSKKRVSGLARRTLGIILLLVTVVLWTASNFLASTIFADNEYSKPYFLTYINSSFFSILLPFVAARALWRSGGSIRGAWNSFEPARDYVPLVEDEEGDVLKPANVAEADGNDQSSRSRLLVDDLMTTSQHRQQLHTERLSIRETAWLSLQFSVLWFLANYFVAACLEYTTVASSTILTSTSSIFTLAVGAALGVEKFSIRKLLGVLASLAGIILISSVDLTGNQDKNRGDFPHKSHSELAIGDLLALGSALLYGVYTSVMKKKIGDESRVDMLLFFGLVGTINLITLLPGFPIFHFLGIETFEMPPNKRVVAIVLINSTTSLFSDICWAYSMLLTSPLVTTVGLSLSIPLSLFGQMIINHQTSGPIYWVGACVVLLSFIFINYESNDTAEHDSDTEDRRPHVRVLRIFQDAWDKFRRR